jgi:zinc and cadmium transporter
MLEIWIYSIASVIIVSLISLIGMFTLSVSMTNMRKILLFLVSFAAGALFGDAFIHLLPEAVESAGFGLSISIYVILGIAVFFIVEKFIKWRHCHIPTSREHPHPIAYMNLVGDGVHNLIDGILIAASFLVNMQIGITTTIAVILHEIPQEIGDFGILLYSGFTKKKALLFNFFTALTAIIGAIFVLLIGQNIDTTVFLVPFAAGGFIYIAGTDLIPELHKEVRLLKSFVQFVAFLLGIAIMFVLLLVG